MPSKAAFAAALRALKTGQPTVSTHAHLLEKTFGAEPFHRRGRTIELIRAGRTLLTITQGLHRHEEEAIIREIGAISRNEYAEQPASRAFHLPAAEMFTDAHVVCLAERRNRPLIAGFLDPAERGATAFESAA